MSEPPTCDGCGHAAWHDSAGIGVCRVDSCGCDRHTCNETLLLDASKVLAIAGQLDASKVLAIAGPHGLTIPEGASPVWVEWVECAVCDDEHANE